MDIYRGGTDLGSVKVYIISPTRTVLIRDPSFPIAFWKLPGGHRESSDHIKNGNDGITAAAIREVREETGIELFPEEIELIWEQLRIKEVYYPYFCVARVSEEKLDTRKKIGDENGRPVETGIFKRAEVLTMPGLLEKHRSFIQQIEHYF